MALSAIKRRERDTLRHFGGSGYVEEDGFAGGPFVGCAGGPLP
jgi:hypothetical protein